MLFTVAFCVSDVRGVGSLQWLQFTFGCVVCLMLDVLYVGRLPCLDVLLSCFVLFLLILAFFNIKITMHNKDILA